MPKVYNQILCSLVSVIKKLKTFIKVGASYFCKSHFLTFLFFSGVKGQMKDRKLFSSGKSSFCFNSQNKNSQNYLKWD